MNQERVSGSAAGYLELTGAQKDGDCEVVEVDGGISKKLGCCNLFGAADRDTQVFSCGTCEYLIGRNQESESKPLGKAEAQGMSFKEILESERPVEER